MKLSIVEVVIVKLGSGSSLLKSLNSSLTVFDYVTVSIPKQDEQSAELML